MHRIGAKEKGYFWRIKPLKYNDFCMENRPQNPGTGPKPPESGALGMD
jgi:hypothetical protein